MRKSSRSSWPARECDRCPTGRRHWTLNAVSPVSVPDGWTPNWQSCPFDHRAVLLSEEALLPDQVHSYAVNVPRSFFRPGAKSISIGLAFSSPDEGDTAQLPVQPDVLHAYRGLDVDAIRKKYATSDDEVPDLPDR